MNQSQDYSFDGGLSSQFLLLAEYQEDPEVPPCRRLDFLWPEYCAALMGCQAHGFRGIGQAGQK